MSRRTKVLLFLILVSIINILIIFTSGISIDIERGNPVFMFALFQLFFACVVGYSATEEPNYKIASLLYTVSIWMAMLGIQYFRLFFRGGLFEGLLISIVILSILIACIYFIISPILKTKKEKEKEQEERNKRDEQIKKINNSYIYTFEDGTEIEVTQEDLYKSDTR
ncbi:hypothetical protein MNQ98_10775 [Paenibacillus sp. N3/727]|uniref:hypothetical protein n=1 Tax=Paenibacillus sp. N3/727 TaxID=2925845 RepID=UPI001F53CDCD|nr:hypothetical protein [Paenibacillus sp. N3/727]UNK20458.1 hypothetical protein MNQ98_10775 [Paenibacillus sp. N3/727]